jgi:hypothetical protein
VAIPQFLSRSFNAFHPIQRHAYATLVPVVVLQRTSTNCRPMLNAYNPEFYKLLGIYARFRNPFSSSQVGQQFDSFATIKLVMIRWAITSVEVFRCLVFWQGRSTEYTAQGGGGVIFCLIKTWRF